MAKNKKDKIDYFRGAERPNYKEAMKEAMLLEKIEKNNEDIVVEKMEQYAGGISVLNNRRILFGIGNDYSHNYIRISWIPRQDELFISIGSVISDSKEEERSGYNIPYPEQKAHYHKYKTDFGDVLIQIKHLDRLRCSFSYQQSKL